MNKHGWTYKKLGDVCLIERGGSPRPIQNFITDAEDGINWIKIGDAVDGSKYISSTKEKIKPEGAKKSRFVRAGDFLLSNSMSFGKPYILQIDGCIHDGWLVIRDENKTFLKDYLYYYLSSPKLYRTFKSLAVGGVVNNLNSKLVRNVDVMIPPMAEQEAIVAELDEINETIAELQQQIADLDTLAQSTFYDMFGDPITNPKGWEVKRLSEISIGKLTYGSGASAMPFDEKFRYIRITDIKDNGDLNDDKVSPNSIDEKYILNEGDILFARSGATVGKTYCHKAIYGKCIYAGYLIRLIPNQEIVLPIYVFHYTKTSYYRSFVEISQRAVAQPNINAQQYGNLNICVPPLALQQEFASRVETIEAAKAELNAQIAEMQTLLASRMDYYFD